MSQPVFIPEQLPPGFPIQCWHNPDPNQFGQSVEHFLLLLSRPTWITIDGKDTTLSRAIVTLLHGNEPSGIIALHRWLLTGEKPATTLHLFFGNVPAALKEPLLSHRQSTGCRDLNRCFKPPYDDHMGKIARQLLNLLWSARPEALLDIHNTSGSGPSFAVAVNDDHIHKALASLFTQRLVVTDLRLGALMELSEHEDHIPTVTIECGGRSDPESHNIALEGIQRFIRNQNVMQYDPGVMDTEILHNPVRLELAVGATIRYTETHQTDIDVCLRPDIENLNFGRVTREQGLGSLGKLGLEALKLKTAKGEKPVSDLFCCVDQQLRPAKTLKLFMVTVSETIAQSDCLLYAVEVTE